MKTLSFVSLLVCFSILGFAQQPPTPPTTPSTARTSTSNGNLDISISETNGTYKLRAKFSSRNDEALQELIRSEFGDEILEKSGKDRTWKLAGPNSEVYSIKLSSGKLRMTLDKGQAAESLTEKFQRIGEDINRLLSGEGDEKSIALEREAAMLQKKSHRMQQEADRLQKGKEKEFSDSQAKALNRKSEELQLQVDSLKRELRKLKEEN